MIKVSHLSIINQQENRTLIKDLTFLVNQGEKMALIGEEGSGKTTLLKALMGLPLGSFEVKGDIRLDSPVGYLEQDIQERWGKTKTLDYFLLKEPGGEVEDYNILARIPLALKKNGFPEKSYAEDKLLGNYSGGEIVRLALVKLSSRDYRTLLLDEPSNDLDLESIALLQEFLKRSDAAVLFVSHDESLLSNCAEAILHLEEMKSKTMMKATYSRLPYLEYLSTRKALEEKQRQVVEKKEHNLQVKKEKWAKIYQEVRYDQDQCVRDPITGRLLKKKMKSVLAMKKRFEKEEEAIPDRPEEEPFLNLSFSSSDAIPSKKRIFWYSGPLFRGEKLLIPNIDFEYVGPGKKAIIGSNGIGKSTFLEKLFEENKTRADIRLGYMSQDYEKSFERGMTVLSYLAEGKDLRETTRARSFLGGLRYTSDEMLYPVSSLSGGQKAKLFFLKMVLDEDNVLLLDEPTRSLSPYSCRMLDALLEDYRGSVLAVSHDRSFLKRLGFEIYRLDEKGLKKTEIF